jgi:DNA-directed RNA polymerase specialized sigma24 family protein
MSSIDKTIRRAPYRGGDACTLDDQLRHCHGPACDACLDVFRLAVVMQDEHAWRTLYRRYYRHISGWCRQAATASAEDLDELVSLTWQRFWRYFTPEKLEAATTIAEVLQYLKMCAGSVAVDTIRARAKERMVQHSSDGSEVESLAGTDNDPAASVRYDLWRVVEGHLRDTRERIVIILRYQFGLKAVEVRARRPDLFPTVADVYRVHRNVLERLRRSPEMRSWYHADEAAR